MRVSHSVALQEIDGLQMVERSERSAMVTSCAVKSSLMRGLLKVMKR